MIEDEVSKSSHCCLLLFAACCNRELIIQADLWGGTNLFFLSSYKTVYICIRDKEIEVAQ